MLLRRKPVSYLEALPYNTYVSKIRWQMKFYILFFTILLLSACDGLSTSTLQESESNPVTKEASVDQAIKNDQPESSLPPPYTKGNIRFEHITVEQGLSQNAIYDMLQDNNGFMWFATQDGLNKYDGYTFTAFHHDPEDPGSLSDNWIWAIHEDSTGVLWVGTRDGGLNSYDGERFTRYQHDPDDPNTLSDNVVLSIAEDQAGALWIGTGNGGLNKLERGSNSFIRYQHDPSDPGGLGSNAVSAIYEDRDGELWIGTTGGGLSKLDRQNDEFIHYRKDTGDLNNPSDLSKVSSTIYEDRIGDLWIGSVDGLRRFDRESGKFTEFRHDPDDPLSLSHDRVGAILEDQSGTLWVGTDGGGLNIYDRQSEGFIRYQHDPGDPHSLSHWGILDIYQDREGVIWFGTLGAGLDKLYAADLSFTNYQNDPSDPNSLSNNNVRGIYEDRSGTLWIASDAGVDEYNQETEIWRHHPHDPDDPDSLSNDIVSNILEDKDGNLWIGTRDGGLNRYDRTTDRFTHYQHDPDDPTTLSHNEALISFEDQDGDLWIGTGGGLNRYDPINDSFIHFKNVPDDPESLSFDVVLAINQDREGYLWIGTLGGLNRFDLKTETFIRCLNDPDDPRSLSHNLVLSIHEDREGNLWIGTLGGLNRFDRATETFTNYREGDGLPNDTVYGILEDNAPSGGGGGNLWLSTNHGLSQFNPQTETFRNYDVTDGLQSNEFSGWAYHQSDSGQMFFGGINGFNSFFPDDLRDNVYVPPIKLTALTQGGEGLDTGAPVEEISEVTFNWPDNFFEFEFAALSQAQPEKNRYAYMLEGFDEDWNEIGTRRYGKYTNLPGGTYTLRLKGSNNDGIWNEEGASIEITIVPPFWATWWFRGLGLLAILAVVTGGYWLRVRNVEARSRELESQVVSRTKELGALNAVAAVVSSLLALHNALTNQLDKTLEIMEIEAGGIYLLQEEDDVLTMAVHKGFEAQFVVEVDNLKVGEGFSGRVALSGEPLIVPDLSIDPRLTRSVVRESDFHSLAVVPLVSRAKVLGTLTVVTRGHREFSQQDIELLTSIGDQIGVAVENAQLYEQAQQAAVVEERQRLARELHDSISQSLHSSILMAEAGQRLAGAGDLERSRGYLVRLGEIAQQAMKEMRLLVYELRPLALRETGLAKALQQRLDTVERRAGVEAKLEIEGEVEIPDDVEEVLFRIAQEALNNALKHAAPTAVVVTIRLEADPSDGLVVLEVTDNGLGFDRDSLGDEGGIGLDSMRERVEKLGGVLTIVSKPGEGTRVKASVPLKVPTDSPNSQEGGL